MATVLLVRHGETAWNRDHRLQGWAPVPLSSRGREQARALGASLAERADVDAVVASDLRRTRETADIVAEAVDAAVAVDAGWRERDFGVLQGVSYDAFEADHAEYSLAQAGAAAVEAPLESGERFADLRERVLAAWADLRGSLDDDETRLVVTHGGPLYVLLGHLQGRGVVESVVACEQANCAVNEVRVDGDADEVVRENDCTSRTTRRPE